jgi:DNA-binding NarL/FixJ family response regulator
LAATANNIHIIGEAYSGKHLIEVLTDTPADVILMDIQMPEMSGVEATMYVTKHFPATRVLVLSMLEEEKYIQEAMKAGALGYILKTTDQEELIHAIQMVARGEFYISTKISMQLLKSLHSSDSDPVSEIPMFSSGEISHILSQREMEVLQLVAKGYTNTEIADKLFTSKRTVESHRQSLLEKTNSKNTACLIMYASRNHLIDESEASGAGS